jgi:drug/metabolite transporter (DMT)-like permease
MRWTAWLVLAATLLLWSGNWIVARAVREDVAPGIATVGRILIVLAILLPFALPGVKKKRPLLSLRDWRIIVALGFTGGGVHLGLQWLGLHYTTATSGIL